ncbi:MAG: aromatic aminobenezylarsenical efflux permease ArsG family transporter [Candidatus Aenigmarchaeota archaeon]|nr:aromatic aminobenezylarsenical efflux permease ArsG family transporter [Candidatus Aenigmarchaeota archaeon]
MEFFSFLEAMGASNVPVVAAFFIGLMTAISPCPLATNLTAIAYASKRLGDGRHTLAIGLLYTLGRMFTYTLLASLITFFGMNTQPVSLFLRTYGEMFLGPLLIICGIVMLDVVKIGIFNGSGRSFLNTYKIKEMLAEKGLLGSFLLGALFALAFCPFSAVLFFGMLIPLALRVGDGILVPAVFAFATGLPVILLSMVLAYSVSKVASVIGKIQTFEKWARKAVSVIFICVGLYYTAIFFMT